MELQRVTLHAAFPGSLRDPSVRDIVRACAEETAEHQGVATPSVEIHDDRVELAAPLPQTVLVVLAAELRRATGRWHRAKFGAPLWQGE